VWHFPCSFEFVWTRGADIAPIQECVTFPAYSTLCAWSGDIGNATRRATKSPRTFRMHCLHPKCRSKRVPLAAQRSKCNSLIEAREYAGSKFKEIDCEHAEKWTREAILADIPRHPTLTYPLHDPPRKSYYSPDTDSDAIRIDATKPFWRMFSSCDGSVQLFQFRFVLAFYLTQLCFECRCQ
jgi:hypothetical protein